MTFTENEGSGGNRGECVAHMSTYAIFGAATLAQGFTAHDFDGLKSLISSPPPSMTTEDEGLISTQ